MYLFKFRLDLRRDVEHTLYRGTVFSLNYGYTVYILVIYSTDFEFLEENFSINYIIDIECVLILDILCSVFFFSFFRHFSYH